MPHLVILDDLKPGDWLTIHHGHAPTCPCGCEGVVGPEPYAGIKGLPLKVLAIQLPYVLTVIVGGQKTVLDLRDCRLMRVEEAYLAAFGVGDGAEVVVPENDKGVEGGS